MPKQSSQWDFGPELFPTEATRRVLSVSELTADIRRALANFGRTPFFTLFNRTDGTEEVIEELSLTPQAYNQKYKHSPVQRPRRRGYLRNVAIALGNSGDEAGIPALTAVLQSEPEALIRGAAAWAL